MAKHHGYWGTLTYSRWKSMMSRCYNVNASNYKYYGGKGIAVCEEWHTFGNFLNDMGECPSKAMTLDRADNALDYAKNNCTWATQAIQNANRTNCILLTFEGKTQNVSSWAKDLNFTANALNQRLRLGWSVERALTTPMKKRTLKK